MKNLVKTSIILLALVSVLFTSCRKEYEIPPIASVPFGDTLTIGDILAMSSNTTFDSIASVCGIVTADEQSGNLYKAIFIQDRATGKAIELVLSSSSAARIGDSVRVCLDSSIMYYSYHNLPQLTNTQGKGFNPDGHLLIYPYNNPIEPKTLTITEIMSGDYIGALVKIENADFRQKNTTFCAVGETTNRFLDDDTYVDPATDIKDAKFVVRTSSYANFAYDYMPISKGSLVAIVSIYNSTYQLTIRSKSEMDFAEWGSAPVPAGQLQSMPYIQSFDTDFGTYTTYNVEGDQTWEIYKSTAKMTGYLSGTNYVNEDWLISSPVAVTGVSAAKVAVTYVAQYQNNNASDVTLQVSTNYTFGDNPSNATWTEMNVTYPNTGGWSDFQTIETSLNNFIGQNVTVAIKFTSTASQSRTFEAKSITVEEGEVNNGGGGGLEIFSETFASGQGEFTIKDVSLSGVNQVWSHDSDYSCMKASAFSQGQHVAESWLVSPAINLSAKGSATLSFQHAVNKGAPTTLSVMVSENYSGDVTTATWTELNVSEWPDGTSWSFKDATADLTSHMGKTVTIAFKYTSEANENNCPTWEVKKLSIKLD